MSMLVFPSILAILTRPQGNLQISMINSDHDREKLKRPTTRGTSAASSLHNSNPSHFRAGGGDKVLKTGDDKIDLHGLPRSGDCSLFRESMRKERLFTDTIVGCLELGG
jgi:hypothetical protein